MDEISTAFHIHSWGANGDQIGTASDLTRDGEIDMKIYNEIDKILIRINVEWAELVEHNKKDSVMIDGLPVNVKISKGKWVTY